ncbi:MAG: recombinase family protein [Flavonifractor plautii]
MEHALRVAAYCRVSTEKEDQLHSLAAQQAYFEGYIARHGWRCAGIFADEGLSGTTLRRPRFAELLRLARSGAVDLILTKEVSRFARNTVDALQVTRRLREQGVGVIFLSDGIDTRDNDGEFRLTIMASVAQEESRKISERTRWGQLQAMRRGVAFGNDTVYGYALRGGALTIRPEQAEVVREVYRKCLEEGKGAHTIAQELTEAGVAPPLRADGAWSPAMILRLLHNEKYCGDLLQKKYRTVDHLTHRKVVNRGAEEQFRLENHHPAVLPWPSLPPSRPSWPGARGWRRGAAFPPATGIPASCVGHVAASSTAKRTGVPMGGSTCASFAGDGERDAP